MISTKFERWVVVLNLFNFSKEGCLGRKEKSHRKMFQHLSENLSLGITITQKSKDLKFHSIEKSSINHEVKSIKNETSLVSELTELVIIQLV